MTRIINKMIHYGLAYLFLFTPVLMIWERPSLTLKVLDVFVILIYMILVIYFYEARSPDHLFAWILMLLTLSYFTLMINIGCIMFFMFPAYVLPLVIKKRLSSLHGKIMISVLLTLLLTSIFIDRKQFLVALIYTAFLLIIFFINDRSAYNNRLKDERQKKDQELARLSKEVERNRISQDLHDSLGQVFSILAVKSELALKMIEVSPEAAQRELDDINVLAKSSLLKVREIVDEVKGESAAVELEQAQELLKSASIEMNYKLIDWQANQDEREVVMLIKELVNNVYKHSQANRVEALVKQVGDIRHITFIDNGIGIYKESINLKSLESRVAKLGGKLHHQNLNPGFQVDIEWRTHL